MIAVLIGSIYIFTLFFIKGIALHRLLFNEIPTATRWMETYFLGLLGLNTIASMSSLFFRASVTFYLTMIIVFCCCIQNKSIWIHFRTIIRNAISKVNFLYLSTILLALISGIKYPYHPDSWLYHIQSIKWLEEYPFIPGLGNLHERFAFNPSFFTLSAALTFRNILGQPIYLINLVSFCIILLHLIFKIIQSKINNENGIQYSFLILSLLLYCGQNSSSPSHDLSSFFYLIPILFIILRQFSYRYDYEIAILLSTAAFLNKITFIPLSIFIVAKFILNYKKIKAYSMPRVHVNVLTFVLAVIIPWFYSNYILSGYLLFPFYKIDLFTPDWKIPIEIVKQYQFLIKDFASRNGMQVSSEFYKFNFFNWFTFWITTLSKTSKLYLNFILLVSGSFLLLFLFRIVTIKIQWSLFILSWLGIIFIMVYGPDIRFIFPYLVMLVLSFKIIDTKQYATWIHLKYFNYLFVTLFTLQVCLSIIKKQIVFNATSVLVPNTNQHFKANLKSSSSTFFIDQLTVRIPTSSFCFDDDLPCTIGIKKIKLRSDFIKDGFKPLSIPGIQKE